MVRLIISDFDGTLVDTFRANFLAYQEALTIAGVSLAEEEYRNYFGLRFDDFMNRLDINDPELRSRIRDAKSEAYVRHFDELRGNQPLLGLIRLHHASGGLTAIASTARERNLLAALRHIGAEQDFDLILAGDCVPKGKPDPEIYNRVLAHFGIPPEDAIAFEDSRAGIAAAEAAGIPVVAIDLNIGRQQ